MTQRISATFILLLTASICINICGAFAHDRKVYIVYMGTLPENDYFPSAHHESILEQILENSVVSESLVRSYGRSFNGFAAKLTDSERQKLVEIEGIVSVFPSMKNKLQTTRSWDFIGFPENAKRIPQVESDVIVGVIDTGIDPNSESFSDEGFGPPPKKWKGVCEGGKNFTCNNKLIGARSYPTQSAIDKVGHGTHIASIIAGNLVKNASFYGLGTGSARGAVPSSRIVAYQACSEDLCFGANILSAFDDAISDGVDLISISLGPNFPTHLFGDAIAIGAFHATQKGILTIQAAGNLGPFSWSIISLAPWLLTAGASTIDRRFVDKVILGDGTTFEGLGVNGFDLMGEKFPLIYGGEAKSSQKCEDFSLNITLVRGKIVYCKSDRTEGSEPFVKKAAGAIVLIDYLMPDVSRLYPLPASALNSSDGDKVLNYIKTKKKPEASILKSEVLKDTNAPSVASFSAHGPNALTPEILKPDVMAPGIDILAAWPPSVSPTDVKGDARSVTYNIVSGTSIACPHVTGAAAYVKSFHPDWSPSAIKSALMTTAVTLNSAKNSDREFGFGSGQIDPVKAVNPGLVYETLGDDYIRMLCSIYTEKQIKIIVGNSRNCPEDSKISTKDLNYPSMASNTTSASFMRTVTNVGVPNSTYTATIMSPPEMEVTVNPKILTFRSLREKKLFTLRASIKGEPGKFSSASLVWSDGIHSVRSPVVLYRQDLFRGFSNSSRTDVPELYGDFYGMP